MPRPSRSLTLPPRTEIRREWARRRLLPFVSETFPAYRPEPVHALIAEHLEAVVRGDIRRLMVFAPPQHGKSQLVSVHLPAWWLGKRPDDPVIVTSYAASLAYSKSRQSRQIVESDEYQALFPATRTRRDSRAVDRWEIEGHRGALLAVGVGGPITGHGALLGIVDDPHENWEQAQSPTYRDRAWEWYRTTFRTRIWEGGAIVLVMTRWHEDDLAGRLLQDQGADWTVLRLPAVAETQEERDRVARLTGLPGGEPDPLGREPGAPLSPGRFSADELARLRREVGSLAWAAEYQGVPTAPDGNRFKRAWFPSVSERPRDARRRVRYWDKAGTEGGGAYTAGVLMSVSPDGVYTVEDVIRGQWSAGERNRVIRETAAVDATLDPAPQVWIEQEPGSGGKESAEMSVRDLAGYPVRLDRVTGSKATRAEPFAAQAEAGNVRLLRAAWNQPWLDELAAFPNGQYKDQVDATSGAFNKLALGKSKVAFSW